jgi:spermidine synthase
VSYSRKGLFFDKICAKMKTAVHHIRGLAQDLIITRRGGTITLWSEAGVRHTVFDRAAPHLPGLEYARNTLAALAFCPKARLCLVLGLGGGSIPRMLLAAIPDLEVDAVEIDPAVVELAAAYFDIFSLPRFSVHVEDAALFLNHCKSRYDIIIVDTYLGELFPEQCASREFLRNAGSCLTGDGVLVVNRLTGNAQGNRNLLMNLQAVIGPVWQLPGLHSHNILYLAAPRENTRPALVAAASALAQAIPFECSLARLIQRLRR